MSAALRRSFVWTSIAALFLDQLTKTIVYGMFNKPGASNSVPLIGSILKISFTTNPHGVFGIGFGSPVAHLILQCVGIILVLFFGLRTKSTFLGCAYGIILGGALGNLIDRFRLGYVIDFLDFEIRPLRFRWFTFNLADAFIVVGVILIFIYEIISGAREKKEKIEKEKKNEDACLSGQQLHNPD
ncbi:MAG: signal peptidase II [candidate division WOR-3 bacterium]